MVYFGRKVKPGRKIREEWGPGPRVPSVLRQAELGLTTSHLTEDMGVWIDPSGAGHHGYYGNVRRAFIGDVRDGGGRALHLPGIAGNYASVPHIDITGSLEISSTWRLSSLATGSTQMLVAQWVTATGFSFALSITGSGNLSLWIRGTDDTSQFINSTALVSTLASVDTRTTYKATFNTSTGVVQFFVDDTQLGSDVAGTPKTIKTTGTSGVEVGTQQAGATTPTNGKVYRAIIKDGIDGTTVLDADFSAQPQGVRAFKCSTGQLVSINQAGSSSAEPRLLVHRGETHLWLPGTFGNDATVPDSAALDITGDISLVAYLPAIPASETSLVEKYSPTSDQRSYLFSVTSGGILRLRTSSDGTSANIDQRDATASVSAGQYVAVFRNAATGQHTFWRSSDLSSWTQVGTAVAGTVQGVFASSTPLSVGGGGSGLRSSLVGSYRAQVWNGDFRGAGTKVLDIDFTDDSAYNATQTSLTAVTGQTVTINRSSSGLKSVVVNETKLVGDGVGMRVVIDDHPDLDVASGEILSVYVATRSYSPATGSRLAAKRNSNSGYELNISTGSDTALNVFGGDGTNITNPAATSAHVNEVSKTLGFEWDRVADEVGMYAAGVDVRSPKQDTSSVTGTAANAEPLSLLGRAGAVYHAGELTGLAVFRRLLTPEERQTLNQELAA